MTPRTLFIIILRILGILSLKELAIAIPQLISAIFSFFWSYSVSDGMTMTVISLLSVAIILWIAYMLIFKAGMLVTMFGLDGGFSEELLQVNISIPSVLRIALIVTGGVILISEIPGFCQIIYRNVSEERFQFMSTGSPQWSPAIFSGVKIVLALLLIGERKRILAFLLRAPAPETDQQH